MTVFSGKQVVPVDCEAEASQRLLEALLEGDLRTASECIDDPQVDVNFVGAVCLKTRKSEVVLRGESASEIRVEYEEFKTDVTALFLAVNCGNATLVKKLLSLGADVNQKLFRGFATTVAAREDHLEILEILLKAGASQPACEEALLEASCHGRARHAELLMGADQIRPLVSVKSLVTACCRGFADVVQTLIQCGVDADTINRQLLLSSKPSLQTNVDCTALVAAIVCRQVSVVRLLLQAGVKTDIKVRLGAWSWDFETGEELRVGAGLAEPYPLTWCAVEYFETSGAILRLLLKHLSPNTPHLGRTLLHHAILCGNTGAVKVLIRSGANTETPIITTGSAKFHPIHIAALYGFSTIIQSLADSGCDVNSRTDSGETALMICARYRHTDCVKALATSGADFALVNSSGQSAVSMAGSNKWSLGFQQVVLDLIKCRTMPKTSNASVFCPLLFAAEAGDSLALEPLLDYGETNIDYQDSNGFSAVMLAAMKGHIEAFRLLVYAGADVKLSNKSGETAITLSELNLNSDVFEMVMLEFALEKDKRDSNGFCALHCAARRGDTKAARLLTSKGYDVNIPDGESYTPLMLAAKEGHGDMCEFLIFQGADCTTINARGETALSLARKKPGYESDAERVIFNELARGFVLKGATLTKHTKRGKGRTHGKYLKMVGPLGILSWGKSRKRNVVCKDAGIGPSPGFRRARKNKGDADEPGIFRVVTVENKEVHFVCEGGLAAAEMWVRGIKLVTREAINGKWLGKVGNVKF